MLSQTFLQESPHDQYKGRHQLIYSQNRGRRRNYPAGPIQIKPFVLAAPEEQDRW